MMKGAFSFTTSKVSLSTINYNCTKETFSSQFKAPVNAITDSMKETSSFMAKWLECTMTQEVWV